MSNTHFFNKEDAERHASRYGGKVMDNTHNNNEWVGNNYTVAGDLLSDVPTVCSGELDVEYFRNTPLVGYVKMTRAEHEAWMESKSWAEEVKARHRQEFTGAINFDGDGCFNYSSI